MSGYRTLAGYGEAEITEKKSRFIGQARAVENESEASEFIAMIRKKHYNARHNVFAYIIGISGEAPKSSDDGEPSGTAGAPVLDILMKEKIYNSVVVVTRYFGGTLLGTGGLVRAYSQAAKRAVEAAGVIEKKLCVSYELTSDYHTYGKLIYELEKNGFKPESVSYAENVTLKADIIIEREAEFLKTVAELCAGRETLTRKREGYFCRS